jgi:hypothetical protein
MSTKILKWVRFADGLTDPLGGSRKNLGSVRNAVQSDNEDLERDQWAPRSGFELRLSVTHPAERETIWLPVIQADRTARFVDELALHFMNAQPASGSVGRQS